jgi:protein-S-isoprenylcysteine O-methyltransferase Ste14
MSLHNYMGEYFLQKIQYSFTLAILLTISIYFFVYHDSSVRIPQRDLYIFMGIILFVLILNIITFSLHVRNTVERKKKDIATGSSGSGETIMKWIQHVAVIGILIVVFSFSAKYSKGSSVPKNTSLTLAILSLVGVLLTLIVFVWSFYGTNSRQIKQGEKYFSRKLTDSEKIKNAT